MILVNLTEIKKEHFPAGEQMLLDVHILPVIWEGKNCFDFYWKYENDEELVTIMFLVKHFRNLYPNCHLNLSMPYMINGRMDRVKSDNEVFTLKYFCEIINSLNFDIVIVLDPHSHVSEALLNHLAVDKNRLVDAIETAIAKSDCDIIYFPDAGALKRYGDMKPFKEFKKIYGKKERDWKTGKILGLSILSDDGDVNELVKDANILMVDDIISYGGTLYYSGLKLKELGAKEINAYVSHTENSVLDKEKGTFIKSLEDGTVNTLYTTDSLFSGKHDKIKFV